MHQSLETEGDYEFIGLYPNVGLLFFFLFCVKLIRLTCSILQGPVDGELRYDMNWGKASPEETKQLARKSEQVEIPPLDPLYGSEGPLPRLWREAVSQESTALNL